MKISKKQKDKNREKLISAAVEIITEKGYHKATMREIAKNAGLGEATIYKYFPTKEKMVYAYYEQKQTGVLASVAKTKDLEKYSLREQLHLLVETGLDGFLGDREFVKETFGMAFISPAGYFGGTAATRDTFMKAVADFLEAAIKGGEIPEQPYGNFIPSLAWDYHVGIIAYWLKDDSERFTNTTLLLDKSLGLAEAILKSGVISHGMELVSFLYRSHISRLLERLATMHGFAGKAKPGFAHHHAG